MLERSLPLVIESQYSPPLEFFVAIQNAPDVIIDTYEYFVKQTYRSRCLILGANGTITLSVPVVGGRRKTPMKDIRVDDSVKWQKIHWRSIASAYGKAPFFEFYAEYFEAFYIKPYEYLIDLNHDVLSCCLKLLSWNTNIKYSESYIHPQSTDYQQFKSVITSKTPYTSRDIYQDNRYLQLFGSEFVPNLSIIDLLMCEGPQASKVLKGSIHPRL